MSHEFSCPHIPAADGGVEVRFLSAPRCAAYVCTRLARSHHRLLSFDDIFFVGYVRSIGGPFYCCTVPGTVRTW